MAGGELGPDAPRFDPSRECNILAKTKQICPRHGHCHAMALQIELGWPAAELSPNARVHPMVLHRFKKAAKTEAHYATRFAMQTNRDWEPRADTIKVHLIAHPKPTGPRPDADNLVSSMKAALDGIADALGVNDRIFEAPTIEWGDKCENGKLFVVLS